MNKTKAPIFKSFRKLDRFDQMALISGIITFAAWVYLLTRKYLNFGYYDWDLAFFHQATWNILHGSQYVSLFGVNFFANHSNFIVYLCLPIYIISAHPLTLIYLKVISYTGGGYLLYLIGKEKVGPAIALLLMWFYLLYPPNLFGIIYEFDFESLSPIFLFSLYYFFERKKLISFFFTALVLITIKENMPAIIVAFGIFALFTKDRNKWAWGILPIILGSILFYALTSCIIPFFRGGQVHSYIGFYSKLGQTPLQVVLAILLHPWKIFIYLQDPLNIKFLFELFSPLLFLPLFSPHILFFISPIFIQYLLSSGFQHHTIYYQYTLNLAPFVFLAALTTLSFLQRFFRRSSYILVLVLMILLSIFSINKHFPALSARLKFFEDHLDTIRWGMVQKIPKDAPAIASFDFLAELSSRKELYAFHKIYAEAYRDSFHVPEGVTWALIDFNDRWLEEVYLTEPQKTAGHLQKFFIEGDWGIEQAAEDIVLFKKGDKQKIIEIDTVTPDIRYNKMYSKITEQLSFGQSRFIPKIVKKGQLLPLTFEWSAAEDIKKHYVAQIIITKGNKITAIRNHFMGYKIYPSLMWTKGTYVHEHYWLRIPDLQAGEYALKLRVVDADTNIPEPVTFELSTFMVQ